MGCDSDVSVAMEDLYDDSDYIILEKPQQIIIALAAFLTFVMFVLFELKPDDEFGFNMSRDDRM